jgi:hypothetical protein
MPLSERGVVPARLVEPGRPILSARPRSVHISVHEFGTAQTASHIADWPQVAPHPALHSTWQLDEIGPHSTLQPPWTHATSQVELSSRQVAPQPPSQAVLHVAPCAQTELHEPVQATTLQVASCPQAMLHPPAQSIEHSEPCSHSMSQAPPGHVT